MDKTTMEAMLDALEEKLRAGLCGFPCTRNDLREALRPFVEAAETPQVEPVPVDQVNEYAD